MSKKSYKEANISYKMPEYSAWNAMKSKCLSPKNQYYKNFGGKGITMCDHWLDKENGFLNFLEDMGERPGKEYFLKLVDKSKSFSPNNCQWATKAGNVLNFNLGEYNKKHAKKYLINGVYYTITQLNETYNISKNTIYKMLKSESSLEDEINDFLNRRNTLEKRKNKGVIKLARKLRKRITEILRIRFEIKKRYKTEEILGCTLEELVSHLESQFTEGMTWENRGLKGWHIDHIIPISSAKTEEEVYKLSHYTNLQPLWAKDNLEKHNKIN